MKLLRVLYVDHTAKIGGGEIALVNLIRSLDRSCVEPTVLLFSDGPLVSRLEGLSPVAVIALDTQVAQANKDLLGWRSVLRLGPVWSTVQYIVQVAAYMRSLKPDIIHANSLKADIIAGLAGRLAGIPVIWHVRDRIDVDYLPTLAVYIFRYLSKIIPNYIVANSHATLSTLRLNEESASRVSSRRPQRSTRYRVIHDGCDIIPLISKEKIANRERRIGIVGRISPWKGQDVFLRAAAELLKSSDALRFEIIGAPLFAEKEYEASLHVLCHSLNIQHAVDFVGFVEDVSARLEILDVLVHASTIGEPFGQVIIEAMASEKPVVATDGGGVPEIVQNGITGLLVPMGNSDRMAQAIQWLLDHPDQATAMGRAGRTRVIERFTIQGTASQITMMYKQITKR